MPSVSESEDPDIALLESAQESPPVGRGVARAPRIGGQALYNVVWRWHFYAGLLTAPVLWIITITGALYVFKTEIVAWRDRDIRVVEAAGERLSYEALRATAERELGTTDLDALIVHPEADRSIEFVADAPGREHAHRHLYLDPYSGKVLADRVAEDDFFAIVLELHRSLLMGSTGRLLGELATSWALILFGTGVYLWWPRGKSNVGVWLPRIRGKLYAVLRDWHTVVGFYMVPLIVTVAATGLVFSLVWGTGFNTTAQKLGHWPAVWFKPPKSEPPTPDAQPASLDRVAATALGHARPFDSVTIRFPQKEGLGIEAWLIQDEDKNSFRKVNIDRYTAETLVVSDPPGLPFLYRVRLWAVSTHMGQIVGLTSKILAFLAALTVFGLSVTGVWMWWERRPRGRTGFPRRPEPGSLPGWGWVIVVAGGVMMPVAGASILLVMLLDRLLAPLRRAWA